MSERHWEEEQRSVLGRLLDFIFGRRDASEEKIDNEIRWLHALQLASRQDRSRVRCAECRQRGPTGWLEPDVGRYVRFGSELILRRPPRNLERSKVFPETDERYGRARIFPAIVLSQCRSSEGENG
jgi:hypothetical protein